MSSHVVNGEVDGEEVLDEVAGGVDVTCRELDKVAGDEDAWRSSGEDGRTCACRWLQALAWKGMCACVRNAAVCAFLRVEGPPFYRLAVLAWASGCRGFGGHSVERRR